MQYKYLSLCPPRVLLPCLKSGFTTAAVYSIIEICSNPLRIQCVCVFTLPHRTGPSDMSLPAFLWLNKEAHNVEMYHRSTRRTWLVSRVTQPSLHLMTSYLLLNWQSHMWFIVKPALEWTWLQEAVGHLHSEITHKPVAPTCSSSSTSTAAVYVFVGLWSVGTGRF